MVKTSAELDHNSFQVGVSGIVNQISELVEVIVNCLLALKIGGCLQDIDGSSLQIQQHKVLSELIFKVQPVNEAEAASLRFLFKFVGHPAAGTSSLHVRHGPNDFGKIVFERFGTKADVGLARSQESLSGSLVSTELGREGRFKDELLPASRRGGYRWCRGSAGRMCRMGILQVLGLCGAKSCRSWWVALC